MKWIMSRRKTLITLVTMAGAIALGSWRRLFMPQEKANHKTLYKILQPKEKHWVGNGFYVSTMFSVFSEDYKHITPFILMDHAAPKQFPATNEKLGVDVHPHRGFETVTFAIQGEIDHRDSGGGGGRIKTGGVQWMTAGSGVVHEEYHSRDFAKTGGIFEMVQLWVNLPAKHKMTTPRYQSKNKEDFPVVEQHEGDIQVKIIAGEYANTKGPAQTFSPINIFEVFSQKTQDLPLELQDQTNTLIVQLKGESQVAGQKLAMGDVAIFQREGTRIDLNISEDSHLLVLNGEPIDEPIAHYGPFVMNTNAEIKQAVLDFQAGKMGQLVEEADKTDL